MASFNVWGLLVLCRMLCPVVRVQGTLMHSISDGDSSSLRCGHRGLEFVLPLNPEGLASAVTVMDEAGVLHALQNDTACGTSVFLKPDGSLVVNADYTGCYVIEKDGEYKMTIEISGTLAGQQIRQLKCPVLLAMDAPSPNVCSGIGTADRMSCSRVAIDSAACAEQSCCYNPSDLSMPCYYGNPVTAYCSPDGHAVIGISKYVMLPYVNLDTIRLLTVTSACSDLSVNSNGVFRAYEFPLSCGSSYQVGDKTVYENRLEAAQDVRSAGGSSITRDSTFRLTVRCSFTSGSRFVPLTVEVFTLPPPLPVVRPGPLVLEMRIARDDSYRSYYADSDYPVVKLLREPVSVEVRVLRRTDTSLQLVLNQCWATPSTSPVEQPQWPILVDKCPFAGDNYRTVLVLSGAASSVLQFPSHYQRFTVSTFTLVDNGLQNIRGRIYFHCSASVCIPSALESCSTVCPSRKRRMTEDLDVEHGNLVTAEGPVDFEVEGGVVQLEGVEGEAVQLEGVVPLEDSHRAEESLLPVLRRGALVAVGILALAGALSVAVGLWQHQKNRQTIVVAVCA